MRLSAAQQRWIAAGLAAITGDADGPCLVPPTGVVERVEGLGAPGVDALPLLGERAAVLGLHRAGRVSCGGATRLLSAADGWVALALARPDDVDLLPAWLGVEVDDGDSLDGAWVAVADAVATRPTAELVATGRELGLPVASPSDRSGGERTSPVMSFPSQNGGFLVVDLSSLWAGPLCTRLLAEAGADVVKVESIGRPDGARRGSQAFFDLLNAGKRSVALDFTDEDDRRRLHRLLVSADVVIEGSRPRALRQLGIVAEELVESGPKVWVSITGHGREPTNELAVGFGDDAAVAGGLVAWGSDGGPRFVADAVADPLAGIAAHRAVLDALARGERGVLDFSLSGVASVVAGPDTGVSWTQLDPAEAPRPSAHLAEGSARQLGLDSGPVLQGLGIS